MKITFEHIFNETTKNMDLTFKASLSTQTKMTPDTERIFLLAAHISETINDIEGPGVNCSGILEAMEKIYDDIRID